MFSKVVGNRDISTRLFTTVLCPIISTAARISTDTVQISISSMKIFFLLTVLLSRKNQAEQIKKTVFPRLPQ